MTAVALVRDKQSNSELPELTVQQLTKWLSAAPENSRRVTVTPELATFILNKENGINIGNRPKKPVKIRSYADQMRSGRWQLTGESIKFGSDGFLKDGQNRLAACVQAGVPFPTHVVFGIDPNVFTVLDRGKPRSPADVFSIAGLKYAGSVAAAVRWIVLMANDEVKSRKSFDPDYLLREFRKLDGAQLEKCVEVAHQIKRVTGEATGAVAALFYLCRCTNTPRADEFFKAWANGAPCPALIKVRKKLMRMAEDNAGRVHEVVRAALHVQAWNAFVNDRKGTIANFAWSLDKPFPAIES